MTTRGTDLTEGSIAGHLVRLAAPLAAGMIFQTLYYLVDLYFVARLGDAAIAGVAAAGNVQFIIMSLTQILGVGTMALIAHAVGRKDQADANRIFNQSLVLSVVAMAITLVGGYGLGGWYVGRIGASPATVAAGQTYLAWFLPGLALQFALVTMGSALRGTGIVKPTMVAQVISVVANVVLAPILIAGWGTGHPLGVAGAGLATTLAVAVAVAMMWFWFGRLEKYVAFDPALIRPDFAVWRRIFKVGLPPGGEFALMFVFMGVSYWVLRGFGPEAQAGYGLGSRVMQAIFLPAMAVSFATAPLAGQNFGAGKFDRVRETFRVAAMLGTAIMVVLTIACRWKPEIFFVPFTTEAPVIAVGAEYLRIVAWNFVASGLIFTCSGMFQALGNTMPALLSSASRILMYVIPAVVLSRQPGFTLARLWWLAVLGVAIQTVITLTLLRRELDRRAPWPSRP